jgi:hypothetical protein
MLDAVCHLAVLPIRPELKRRGKCGFAGPQCRRADLDRLLCDWPRYAHSAATSINPQSAPDFGQFVRQLMEEPAASVKCTRLMESACLSRPHSNSASASPPSRARPRSPIRFLLASHLSSPKHCFRLSRGATGGAALFARRPSPPACSPVSPLTPLARYHRIRSSAFLPDVLLGFRPSSSTLLQF